MAALVQRAQELAIAPVGMSAEGIAFAGLHDEEASTDEYYTSESVAIRRALYELMDGRDSEPLSAIRALAQAAFDMAAVLKALANQILRANPEVERAFADVVPGSGLAIVCAESDVSLPVLSVPTALAIAVDALLLESRLLGMLDEKIRTKCLSAPYDRAPRGALPKRGIWLAAIKALDRGKVTEKAIVELVHDGKGGSVQARARRIRESLDRDEASNGRTLHIRGRP